MNKTKHTIFTIIIVIIFLISGFAEPIIWNWYQIKFNLSHNDLIVPMFMLIIWFFGLLIISIISIIKLLD